MKQVRPLFFLDMEKRVHYCFQEAVLSSIVITIYMIMTDLVEEYIGKQPIPKWQKYMLNMTAMFVASFVAILFILFLFGYRCNKK
jgi:hypothetical protein